jgi:geranylgeranylglycerol-phosphate geranylgeranyltransferase
MVAVWFLGLAHLYNLGGKRVILLGNLIVAFLTAFPLLYGIILASYYMSGSWDWGDYVRSAIFWSMIFLSVLGREVSKGIVDIEGDRVVGVKTIANTYGARVAALAALTLYTLAVLLSIAPVALGVVNTVPYLVMIIPVDLLALLEGLSLASNPTRERAIVHKRRVLLLMLVAMIGLYIGSAGA